MRPWQSCTCVTLQFPLQVFVLAMGIFQVLVTEQVTLAYREQSVPPVREETRALLETVNGGPQPWRDGQSLPQDQSSGSSLSPACLCAGLLPGSVLGAEGAGSGLQCDQAQAMELCLALLLHQGIWQSACP